MKFSLAAALVLCASTAIVAGEPNRFKKVKVGDWVEYKSMLVDDSGKIKITVADKGDNEVTLRTVATDKDGKAKPAKVRKIDLTKSLDLADTDILPKGPNTVKIENGRSGAATLQSGGKSYKCTWKEFKVTNKRKNRESVSDVKIWISEDAPFYGLVRMESVAKLDDFTVKASVELIGFGSK